MEFSKKGPEENISIYKRYLDNGFAERGFGERIVCGVYQSQAYIDQLIQEASLNWRIDRMNRVDLAILRVSVYELLYSPEIPKQVIINEAVELAKKYGTENSGAFVNGILEKISQQSRTNSKFFSKES
jgi:N utilization substance protein B